jgi:hypothetical protein
MEASRPAPWGWQQAVQLQLVVIVFAFIAQPWLHLLTLPAIKPPFNWVIAGILVIGVGLLGALLRRELWMRWLSGPQYAITSIAVVAVISAIGALIPQDPSIPGFLTRTGLRAIYTSPLFATAILLLLVNLVTVTGRRLATPRSVNPGFLLNHLGLLLVLVGAMAGAVQHHKATLTIGEGETSSLAVSDDNTQYVLPAKITLNSFDIEKYPPKLAALEFSPLGENHKMATDTEWPATGHHFRPFGVDVAIEEYIPFAFPDEQGNWAPAAGQHGLPAARVRVTVPSGKAKEGWITPEISDLGIAAHFLDVDEQYRVGLLEQTPKAYRSHLTIVEPGKAARTVVLEVNHPISVGNWLLYQTSYKLSMNGRISFIEAVTDPALPIVYLGFAGMVLGAFLALWFTPRRRRKSPGLEEAAEEARQ